MRFVVYYYRRGPGDQIPMQQRREFGDERGALKATADILNEGSDAPVHIADEKANVLLHQPEIMRRLGRWQ